MGHVQWTDQIWTAVFLFYPQINTVEVYGVKHCSNAKGICIFNNSLKRGVCVYTRLKAPLFHRKNELICADLK